MLDNLKQFTGTENWYPTAFGGLTFTDGAKYVADEAGAYWLLDDIGIYQMEPVIQKTKVQIWKLAVDKKSKAVLSCEDGNGNVVLSKKLNFTTFPEPGIELWCINKVILLPSEY